MESQDQYVKRLERARKRVKEIKGFYTHLRIFVVVNLLIFLFEIGVIRFTGLDGLVIDANVVDWIGWNVVVNRLLWLTFLIGHGLYVFHRKFRFLKDWEARQIKKYMEEEQNERNKYY